MELKEQSQQSERANKITIVLNTPDLRENKPKSKPYDRLANDSILVQPVDQTVVQYEPQYDPNNDFAIFGTGDHTTGGIQDMKEKMNIADQNNQGSSSESDDESPLHRHSKSKLWTK